MKGLGRDSFTLQPSRKFQHVAFDLHVVCVWSFRECLLSHGANW